TTTARIFAPSLHDALPISPLKQLTSMPTGNVHFNQASHGNECEEHQKESHEASTLSAGTSTLPASLVARCNRQSSIVIPGPNARSEEHTSELQSRENLVCR